MTALTTLDGVENGSDIAIVQGGSRSKWKLLDGQMVDEHGDPLDMWFFAGLLSEGSVHLANFSPPQIGEWFGSNRSHGPRFWLALSEESPDGEVWAAQFTRGVYDGVQRIYRIVEVGTRREPDWLTEQVRPVLLAMGTSVLTRLKELEQANRIKREWRGLTSELEVVKSYVNSMSERAERMRAS